MVNTVRLVLCVGTLHDIELHKGATKMQTEDGDVEAKLLQKALKRIEIVIGV